MLIYNLLCYFATGLYTLGLQWHGIKVYRWGFSRLDYFFDVLVSWSCDLRLYDWFYSYSILFSFINFIDFMLVLKITGIILSALFFVSLTAPVCLCSRQNFQYMLFWLRLIDARVLISARHLAFTTPLVGEYLTPLDLHVQIPEFGACGFSRLLIRDAQRERGSSADRLSAPLVAWTSEGTGLNSIPTDKDESSLLSSAHPAELKMLSELGCLW